MLYTFTSPLFPLFLAPVFLLAVFPHCVNFFFSLYIPLLQSPLSSYPSLLSPLLPLPSSFQSPVIPLSLSLPIAKPSLNNIFLISSNPYCELSCFPCHGRLVLPAFLFTIYCLYYLCLVSVIMLYALPRSRTLYGFCL